MSLDQANEFMQYILSNPSAMTSYDDLLKQYNYGQNLSKDQAAQFNTALIALYKKDGYDCTPVEVYQASENMKKHELSYYTGNYINSYINSKKGPSLVIENGKVTYNEKSITNPTYSDSQLTWKKSDGNDDDAILNFVMLTGNTGKSTSKNEYLGPEVTGKIGSDVYFANLYASNDPNGMSGQPNTAIIITIMVMQFINNLMIANFIAQGAQVILSQAVIPFIKWVFNKASSIFSRPAEATAGPEFGPGNPAEPVNNPPVDPDTPPEPPVTTTTTTTTNTTQTTTTTNTTNTTNTTTTTATTTTTVLTMKRK
jgi:hypothetical protein